eukprot:10604959-Lingulodinium_polyedra.AAC.1
MPNPNTRRSGNWRGTTRHSGRAFQATYVQWTAPYRLTSLTSRTSDGHGSGPTAALRQHGD